MKTSKFAFEINWPLIQQLKLSAPSSNKTALRMTKTPTKCFKERGKGVCVSEADYNKCESHEDCQAKGGKCCSDYCCNEKYYNSLNEIVSNCNSEICKVSIFYVFKGKLLQDHIFCSHLHCPCK